jgi:hypothetical protein
MMDEDKYRVGGDRYTIDRFRYWMNGVKYTTCYIPQCKLYSANLSVYTSVYRRTGHA